MRILLITAHFPPKNVIGSLRLYSFAYYWHLAGHNITVLTMPHKRNAYDLNLDISNFNIIETSIPLISNFQSSESNSNLSKNENILKNIIKKIFSFLKMFYNFISDNSQRFPSFFDLWAKKAIKSINAFDYDIVLSSGGPYSVHRVGLYLKNKNKKIKWIVDWRDLWTPSFKSFGLFNFYEKKLEKTFHKNADLITCVSEPNSKIISSITSTSVKTIYNGFIPDDSLKTFNNIYKDKFTIVYIGSFYRNMQDPSPFFEAISRIKKKNIEFYNKLQIIFAGKNSNVIDLIQKYDISECYSFLGYIKMEESLSLQYNSDAVLFIDYNSNIEGIISAKIFEYIYYSKSIIAIGNNSSSSAADLIKKTNTGIYLGSDIDIIEKYLIENVSNPIKYNKNNSVILEFTRENQAKKLLNYILQLT